MKLAIARYRRHVVSTVFTCSLADPGASKEFAALVRFGVAALESYTAFVSDRARKVLITFIQLTHAAYEQEIL